MRVHVVVWWTRREELSVRTRQSPRRVASVRARRIYGTDCHLTKFFSRRMRKCVGFWLERRSPWCERSSDGRRGLVQSKWCCWQDSVCGRTAAESYPSTLHLVAQLWNELQLELATDDAQKGGKWLYVKLEDLSRIQCRHWRDTKRCKRLPETPTASGQARRNRAAEYLFQGATICTEEPKEWLNADRWELTTSWKQVRCCNPSNELLARWAQPKSGERVHRLHLSIPVAVGQLVPPIQKHLKQFLVENLTNSNNSKAYLRKL